MFTAQEFLTATPHPPDSLQNSSAGPRSTAAASSSNNSYYDAPPPGAPPLPPAFYSRIAAIPLLLSPALRLPDPISFPQDLHPLPLDIKPYMIYPFSLEAHVLHPASSSASADSSGPLGEEDPIEVLQAAREYLQERVAQAERDRKSALQRVAPGWAELEGRGGILEPTRRPQQQQPQPQLGGAGGALSPATTGHVASPIRITESLI
ncbi:hypothetical protein V8E36_004614 [Tilletia maclaganii]